MQHRLVRWLMSVSGIIMIIVSLIVGTSDFITCLMLALCGALCTGLGLGFFGE